MSILPPLTKTEPDVFILESLSLADEAEGRLEGRILRDILKLSGKNPKYYYFRTERELVELAQVYRESGYRFLHISCHGSHEALATTFDNVSYANFASVFDGLLKNRRLFVSACEMGNELFSTIVAAKNKGMYSIIAPTQRIRFDRAAAIWAAFYVLMFDLDARAMKADKITRCLRNLARLFSETFHFSRYNAKHDKWEHETISHLVVTPDTAAVKATVEDP